jgi:hypothetical protein
MTYAALAREKYSAASAIELWVKLEARSFLRSVQYSRIWPIISPEGNVRNLFSLTTTACTLLVHINVQVKVKSCLCY